MGETGLRDQVDRHYAESLAPHWPWAPSRLAQADVRGLARAPRRVSPRRASSLPVGAILDRFLNLLPTVTIREGHRIKVYLSNDLELPAYRDEPATAHPPTTGGHS
jgi:type IV secretion system protein VirB10